jgi:uncharacterized OB-fold protein
LPKQSPVPDDIDRAFWEACNQERFIIQYCEACSRFQHPPQATCFQCNSANLTWRDVEGRGTIYSYGVIYDTPIAELQPDQPYNCAVIDLDGAPGINVMSHLPGTPVDEVPIGAKVRLVWETTKATGQKIPEWQIEA